MSWRLSADALDYSPYDGRTLLVLISLASWADDDGSHVFPRVETLAKKARCSVRQAQRALRQLEQDGVLLVVRKGGGRSLTEYKIDVEKLRAGQGCQNGTGDTNDAQNAENVTSEVTKTTSHIDTRSNTRSVTRSLSQAPAGAAEGGKIASLGKGEPERFEEFRSAIVATWPDGFDLENEWACQQEFGRQTRHVTAESLIECARLQGEAWRKREASRYKSAGKMLVKMPATWLRDGGWRGFVVVAQQQREVEARTTSALGRVHRALGPQLVEVFRHRLELTDAVMAALDGIYVEPGPPPLFLVAGGGAKAVLERHQGALNRILGDGVEIRLMPKVNSA